MSNTLDMATRRALLTAFRYACPDSPASCAKQLTDYAITRCLVGERGPILGEALRKWAAGGKPPLWAAWSAGLWLIENDYEPVRTDERAAMDVVRNFHIWKGRNSRRAAAQRGSELMQLGVPMPKRIQLRRIKGWKKPPGAVVVARPTKWGNPYKIRNEADRVSAVSWYETQIAPRLDVSELRGKDLACWCPLDKPCHADVLLRLANS